MFGIKKNIKKSRGSEQEVWNRFVKIQATLGKNL